ncbi:MAG: alpha/beta fold hydrolase [Flavobacteriales bacterium]
MYYSGAIQLLTAIFVLAWCTTGCSRLQMLTTDELKTEVSSEMKSILLHPDGFQVHCMVQGADSLPTLFIVHGSPGSWKDYKKYLEDGSLTSHFRVVVFDRPGFGKSDPGYAVGIIKHAELLYACAMQLNNNQPGYWVGHSLGGPIVAMLASMHPDATAGIAILAGSVSPEEEAPEHWRKLLKWPAIRWLIPARFDRSNVEIMRFKKDIRLLDDCWKNISCPVLIVHGTKDPLVPYKNAEYANQKLEHNPSVKLVSITKANHFIPWEHYKLITDLLKSSFP